MIIDVHTSAKARSVAVKVGQASGLLAAIEAHSGLALRAEHKRVIGIKAIQVQWEKQHRTCATVVEVILKEQGKPRQ